MALCLLQVSSLRIQGAPYLFLVGLACMSQRMRPLGNLKHHFEVIRSSVSKKLRLDKEVTNNQI
tara:strand:- start:961 stop:1152 length:192 start_codon:yes stop_codon:yes gene_type:complete